MEPSDERQLPEVELDTPYFKGRTKAVCMKNTLYDVIIGNVPGAKDHKVRSGVKEVQTETEQVEERLSMHNEVQRRQVEENVERFEKHGNTEQLPQDSTTRELDSSELNSSDEGESSSEFGCDEE